MQIIGLVIIYLVIVLIDLPLIRKKSSRRLRYILSYSITASLGFIVGLLQIIDRLPISLARVIEVIITGNGIFR